MSEIEVEIHDGEEISHGVVFTIDAGVALDAEGRAIAIGDRVGWSVPNGEFAGEQLGTVTALYARTVRSPLEDAPDWLVAILVDGDTVGRTAWPASAVVIFARAGAS